MDGAGSPRRYRAALLRRWEGRGQDPQEPGAWRYSVEDPHTGERLGFASLDAALAFLGAALAGGARAGDAGGHDERTV